MVIKRVLYRCEICHHDFDNEAGAIKCESKGRPKPMPHLVGLMYPYFHREVILAVPPHYGTEEGIARLTDKHHPHCLNESLWATRENGNHSIGEEFCGGGNYFKLDVDWAGNMMPADLMLTDYYKTMVLFLRSQGITPKQITSPGVIEEIIQWD